MTMTTGTILDTIVADTRAMIARSELVSLDADSLARIRSLRGRVEAYAKRGALAVIAEHKRRSPSRGRLAPAGDELGDRVRAYESAGVAGISVLTERDHFAGSMDDLAAARAATDDVPLLCKDFIVDEQQLVQARAYGADAVLLIAALHDAAALDRFVGAAHELGLEVLLEVHTAAELTRASATRADLIGINARDLRSFRVDLAVVEQLASLVVDRPVIAESGIATAVDAARVQRAGAAGVLVGQRLMAMSDPRSTIEQLMAGGAS